MSEYDFEWNIGDYIKVDNVHNKYNTFLMECFSIIDGTGRFRATHNKDLDTIFIAPRNYALKLAGCFRVTKEENPEYFL